MTASNRTHRVRLARALAAMADLKYQTALTRVVEAAETGRLPARLDAGGMRRALDMLLAEAGVARSEAPAAPAGANAVELEPRYYRLREVIAGRLEPGVADRVTRAREAGAWPAYQRGDGDLFTVSGVDEAGFIGDEDDEDERSDWWRRALAGGVRGDFALPCHYPPSPDLDYYLPIDLALEQREADGDVDAYERELRRIVAVEPHDIDAYAHLGHLYLEMATPGGRIRLARPLTAPTRRRLLRAALAEYQTGIMVGELALPDPFTGFLSWGELNNRPLHRALHGVALALWRLERFDAAERALLNLLWLNPLDNQGARFLLPEVRSRQPWHPDEDE